MCTILSRGSCPLCLNAEGVQPENHSAALERRKKDLTVHELQQRKKKNLTSSRCLCRKKKKNKTEPTDSFKSAPGAAVCVRVRVCV